MRGALTLAVCCLLALASAASARTPRPAGPLSEQLTRFQRAVAREDCKDFGRLQVYPPRRVTANLCASYRKDFELLEGVRRVLGSRQYGSTALSVFQFGGKPSALLWILGRGRLYRYSTVLGPVQASHLDRLTRRRSHRRAARTTRRFLKATRARDCNALARTVSKDGLLWQSGSNRKRRVCRIVFRSFLAKSLRAKRKRRLEGQRMTRTITSFRLHYARGYTTIVMAHDGKAFRVFDFY